MKDKQALRRELLSLRSSIAAGDRARRDKRINQAITGHPWFKSAQAVLGFYPIGSEPDIRPILEEALEMGKALYLPRCEPSTGEMAFYQVHSLAELKLGAHGIPEPAMQNCPLPEQFHCFAHCPLCLVPGLAFDDAGFRLGYGKGYYDKFLAQYKGKSIGICYAAMRQAALPRQAHDLAVDTVACD